MKSYGHVNFQQNEVQNAVLPLDTAFPASPKAGQFVFRDKTLYFCVEINSSGIPIWVPLTKQITAYEHIQNTNSTVWTVNHNLNTQNISVTVFDSSNRVVIPDEIEVVSDNQVVISVTKAATGKASVISGFGDGTTAPTYAYEFIQATPATTWTINHGLNRYPIVRVFIGTYEVQPESISFPSQNTTVITFSTAQVGQVKLI